MALINFDHMLIQTDKVEETKDWYVDVLGLRVGNNPDFKFPVYWLFIGHHDVVHITAGGPDVSDNRKAYLGQESEEVYGSAALDHIAFHCTDLGGTMEHLTSKGVEFSQRRVDDDGSFQLFMFDPNGIKIELNFAEYEARGFEPELKASDLAG
jgi:catechol 2,3-dioxygenase-like lactoylglutathione lyase family enzyme